MSGGVAEVLVNVRAVVGRLRAFPLDIKFVVVTSFFTYLPINRMAYVSEGRNTPASLFHVRSSHRSRLSHLPYL